MGIAYARAGILEWSKRKPEVAVELFDKAVTALKHDRILTKRKLDSEREAWIVKAEENLEILKRANIVPNSRIKK